jgi:hypothetical protein
MIKARLGIDGLDEFENIIILRQGRHGGCHDVLRGGRGSLIAAGGKASQCE